MPFSVKILRFFGILLLSLCALGVAGMTWAYLDPIFCLSGKWTTVSPSGKGREHPLKSLLPAICT